MNIANSTPIPADVAAAFEILLEEMESEIGVVKHSCQQGVDEEAYNRARMLIDQAEAMTQLRSKVIELRNEWQETVSHQCEQGEVRGIDESEESDPSESIFQRQERADYGRLRRGLRTPEYAYYQPILEVLVEMGGRGNMSQVLENLVSKVKGQLKEVDFEPLPSNPETIRWRNTAQWARNTMVENGLLKNDSRRGIWEISEKGRGHLISLQK